ncbi:hypothetical protein H6G65_16495 [Microcystis elabens FACHB-917]|nr:hypothetical protein [Microcystis elabens FACHB-917]
MTVNRESLEKLGRFLLRGLRIGASTVSIVELLRNDWTGGISAGVAWLVFLQVERRLPPLNPKNEDRRAQPAASGRAGLNAAGFLRKARAPRNRVPPIDGDPTTACHGVS